MEMGGLAVTGRESAAVTERAEGDEHGAIID
ncbi:hypothetical protein BH23CHL5_BH23CHL5_00460 [soil metagenome]